MSYISGYFDLDRRGSTPVREVIAGFTTFGAMSYILVVNPAIMSAAGMDRHELILVTAIASIVGTLIMALSANLPIALAPGMGSNVVFAQIVVLKFGVSYQTALTMVLFGAILFTVLSLSRFRERIIQGFPDSLRLGMQCGLGLMIGYIGLSNAGLLVHSGGRVGLGDLLAAPPLLALVGILLALALVQLRIPAALLISIILITIAGIFVTRSDGQALTHLPDRLVDLPAAPRDLLLAFNFREFFSHFFLILPITLYFFLSDFFSATATFVGVTRRAGMMDASGAIPKARRAFAADGIASIIGAMLGSSTVVAFVESATGVEAGGRSGLTGITVAVLFGVSVFLWPLIACIPPQATAPAMVLVGIMMMTGGVREFDLSKLGTVVPTILMLVITIIMHDLLLGLAAACFLHTLIALKPGTTEKITPMLLTLDAVFILYIALAETIR